MRVSRPGDTGATRPDSVCMFVYNACANDPRVLKEAQSLTNAGYDVQIVAVLDKNTTPEEMRDGFRIVRIDRNPPHYRLLRTSRRVRRWLRLKRASTVRCVQNRQRRWARSAARRRLHVPRAVVVGALVLPHLLVRVYRYGRWRILKHVPPIRHAYYRRRNRGRRPLQRLIYRLRMRQYRARGFTIDTNYDSVGIDVRVPLPKLLFTAPGVAVVGAFRLAGTALSTAEKRVSHWCWRTIMVSHKPLMFLDYYRRAYKHVKSQGFTVVHAHDLTTLPVAAAVARATGARLVYDAHELYTEMSTLKRVEKQVWKVTERLLIGSAHKVVTVCDSIAQDLQERYSLPDQPLTMLNCPPRAMLPPPAGDTDVNRLRAKAALLDSSTPIVLYQGGFAPNRGLEELVDAAAYLDDAVLVMMGWGRIEQELRARIAHQGLEQRVLIVEPAQQSELLSFTRGADVGVIPYKAVGLNNYYTTPNKLFEYMGAGIAIAGSRFPELKRFIEGYQLGLTFDPDDPYDIALAVNSILADRETLAAMKQNAATASQEFVWERESAKLVALYADLEPPATAVNAGVATAVAG